MKLFFQLSDEEQQAAVDYCLDITLHNLLDPETSISMEKYSDGEDDDELAKIINEARAMKDEKDQIDFLFDNEISHRAIHEISYEMAKNTFYHDEEENVIFLDELVEESEENQDLEEDAAIEADIKKSDHSLN